MRKATTLHRDSSLELDIGPGIAEALTHRAAGPALGGFKLIHSK